MPSYFEVQSLALGPTLSTVSAVADCRLGNSFKDERTGSRTISIHNIKDGQSIGILVQGQTSDVITITAFSDSGVTQVPVKYGAGQNGQMVSTYSLFTIYRIGNDFCVVGPIHGIQ